MISHQSQAVAAMLLQTGYSAGPEAIPTGPSDGKRYLLYVVARSSRTLADDIFRAMRRDMASASVELIYDRRVGERRNDDAGIDRDRRASDRRRRDSSKEITTRGWARVEFD
jgi:hypothetical protein